MELREAKKPFTVEKRPVKARKSEGRPMRGVRRTPSGLVPQEKNGAKERLMLLR